VPLESHWRRVNTPLRETTLRERRILLVVGGLLALAVVVGVIAFVSNGSSSPPTPAGCVRLEVGSTMGGVTTQLCGSTATKFCGSPAAHSDESYLGKCREAGLATATTPRS
jgi:hypothetical protein